MTTIHVRHQSASTNKCESPQDIHRWGYSTFPGSTFPDKASADLGSIWGRFRVDFGSVLGPFGVGLGWVWGGFGIDLGSVWDRFGSIWDRFGIGLGSVWNQFGIVLGSFGVGDSRIRHPPPSCVVSRSQSPHPAL